jgi:nucleoside triphosphate pyrophosphatase
VPGDASRLVLASRSPQRRAILEGLGVAFEVRPADVVEEDEGPPLAVAAENALRKAVAGRARPDEVVLGVDTIVVTDDLDIWGKPPDAEAARETLRRLSGRTHRVISGVALVDEDGSARADEAITYVTFRRLDDAVIDWYLASEEWEGRAGGYAIQGRGGVLVERIEGDYLNVVGLPVGTLLGLWPDLLGVRIA